ncbi:hypothetical protein Pla86_30250 [Planctomycetes bacterium Pla86]|uniref:Uncharacterized protein n=1 Tax=Engelhardtia mirabilis TaxID=2528011 RepID=A0A518BLW1_9BACT|nr:hypothetical protein Pla133_30260 [Planctomycetes bacterium Pla133]QDV02263.1 hypothetical protein Pla86_30250 [Planctomycetes bacterium Pla86]
MVAILPLPAVLLPGTGGAPDLLALLAWLTWTGGAAGWLAGAAGVRPVIGALCASAAWSLAVACAVALGPQRQVDPGLVRAVLGLGPALGLAVAGLAWGARRPTWAPAGATATLALTVTLCALPGRADLVERGWAERRPQLAATLLDLSPLSVAAETAGVDWMRHPSVYGPAGTDWFSDRRRPHGPLAAMVALVLGCSLGFASAGVRRADRNAARSHR